MPCRVGITTDLEVRKRQWERKVVGLKNWRILKECLTRKEAQEYEDWYKKRYGCVAFGGGNTAKGPWYVYRFDYIRKR